MEEVLAELEFVKTSIGSSDESKEKDLKSSPSIFASPLQNSLTSSSSSSLMLKSS